MLNSGILDSPAASFSGKTSVFTQHFHAEQPPSQREPSSTSCLPVRLGSTPGPFPAGRRTRPRSAKGVCPSSAGGWRGTTGGRRAAAPGGGRAIGGSTGERGQPGQCACGGGRGRGGGARLPGGVLPARRLAPVQVGSCPRVHSCLTCEPAGVASSPVVLTGSGPLLAPEHAKEWNVAVK